MRLSTQTDYLNKVFGFEKAIDMLAEAGYDCIDFSAYFEEHYTDVHDKSFYTEMRKYAESKGLTFNQAHAPFASSFNDDEEKTEKRFWEIVTAMKNASYLGVENIVVHPYIHIRYHIEGNPEILFEKNMQFYRRLIPYCEEYGIKVALENMWDRAHSNLIGHCACSRPGEFVRYMDELNNDCFVGCLDIGHTMLVREETDLFIKALGNKRLKCLHVHDVVADQDLHTLPYFGVTDWDSVMKALAEIDYKGDLTFEADCFFNGKPVELLQDTANYMAKTGRILISKFEEYK